MSCRNKIGVVVVPVLFDVKRFGNINLFWLAVQHRWFRLAPNLTLFGLQSRLGTNLSNSWEFVPKGSAVPKVGLPMSHELPGIK